MSMRDGIFNTVAIVLGAVAMAGLLGTDAYSQAAGAEARGLKALSLQMEMPCGDPKAECWAAAPTRGQP